MSDRIGVMRDGRLVQVGTPNEIYTAPNSKFVSEFIGDVNIIPVRLNGSNGAACRTISTRHSRAPGCRERIRGRPSGGAAGIRCASSTGAEDAENVPRPAGSTTNTRSARASSTRCASASRSSSSSGCASRRSAGQLDSDVLIGWNARDSILVGD